MDMLLSVLLGLMCFCATVADVVPFKHCKDSETVLGVNLNPCNAVDTDGWTTCVFQHGTKLNVEAAFTAPFSSSQLETVSSAHIGGHLVPLPSTGSNPCLKDLMPPCPVQEEKMYIYTTTFDILKYYPTGRMEVIFSIRDKRSRSVLGCAKVPIIIKRNPMLSYKN